MDSPHPSQAGSVERVLETLQSECAATAGLPIATLWADWHEALTALATAAS